jgi:hypothetical protein
MVIKDRLDYYYNKGYIPLKRIAFWLIAPLMLEPFHLLPLLMPEPFYLRFLNNYSLIEIKVYTIRAIITNCIASLIIIGSHPKLLIFSPSSSLRLSDIVSNLSLRDLILAASLDFDPRPSSDFAAISAMRLSSLSIPLLRNLTWVVSSDSDSNLSLALVVIPGFAVRG